LSLPLPNTLAVVILPVPAALKFTVADLQVTEGGSLSMTVTKFEQLLDNPAASVTVR
jgi:hypothetical protein